MVPMVSLLERFYYTGLCTVVPAVSLLHRFHYTGLCTVVPAVSLLHRFHYTGLCTVVPAVSLLHRFHYTGLCTVVPAVSLLHRFHSIGSAKSDHQTTTNYQHKPNHSNTQPLGSIQLASNPLTNSTSHTCSMKRHCRAQNRPYKCPYIRH